MEPLEEAVDAEGRFRVFKTGDAFWEKVRVKAKVVDDMESSEGKIALEATIDYHARSITIIQL